MKLKTLLAFAGVGVAVGLLLTKTEKGRAFRNDIADRAQDWSKKLTNLASKAQDDLSGLMDDGMATAGKLKKRANNQLS